MTEVLWYFRLTDLGRHPAATAFAAKEAGEALLYGRMVDLRRGHPWQTVVGLRAGAVVLDSRTAAEIGLGASKGASA